MTGLPNTPKLKAADASPPLLTSQLQLIPDDRHVRQVSSSFFLAVRTDDPLVVWFEGFSRTRTTGRMRLQPKREQHAAHRNVGDGRYSICCHCVLIVENAYNVQTEYHCCWQPQQPVACVVSWSWLRPKEHMQRTVN